MTVECEINKRGQFRKDYQNQYPRPNFAKKRKELEEGKKEWNCQTLIRNEESETQWERAAASE